ncbi:MAG: hypothetical protein R2710_17135 [Acidimicrobiales bacterium]
MSPHTPTEASPFNADYDAETARSRAGAAEQLRRLHHALVGHLHDPALVDAVTEQLSAVADQLETGTPRQRLPWTARSERMIPADGELFTLDFDRPVSGPGNPWSIPTPVRRIGHKAVTTVELGQGYEGAPQRSHGGIVAAIYDDLCGFNLVLEAELAFTGWIRINYKAPTPLHEPITFATWIEQREGRKLGIVGECHSADGTLLSTCEALFIKVDPEQMSGGATSTDSA